MRHIVDLRASQNRENAMATKKSTSKRGGSKSSSSRGKGKVAKVMREYKRGSLKSGGGGKVKSRKQAVAIALSEARESGANIPKKRGTAKKKGGAKRKSSMSKKRTSRKSS